MDYLDANSISQKHIVKNKFFNSHVNDVNTELTTIKNSLAFNKYLSDDRYKELSTTLLLNTTKSLNKIMKLRYIDRRGREKISINRHSSTLKPYVTKINKLQNRRNSHYFKSTLNTPKDKTWSSALNSSKKQQKAEMDSIVYLGTPIFIKEKIVGVLIADISMKDLLHEFVKTPSNKVYLFDSNGNTLIDHQYNGFWSKYLQDATTIHDYFSKEAKDILTNNEYFGNNFYSNKIYLNDDDAIYMVIAENRFNLSDEITSNSTQLLFTILVLFILSIPLSYLFAQIPVRQKNQADKQKYDQDVLLSLFDLSDAVLFKWNNDKAWSVDSVSKSVQKLLAYTQNDFQSGSISYMECIHPDDLQEVLETHKHSIRNKAYFFEHKPYRLIRKDGDIKWILHSTIIVRGEYNKITSFLGYLTDITELKNKEIELKSISITDQLTKINNRMYTDSILKNQYNRFKRDGEICSIIIIDIDHFKSVNDNYGHLAGDNVLVEFAGVLKSFIRVGDELGRWGGEEFLIILPHTNLKQAMILAEKLKNAINVNEFPTPKHLTASFGVSTFKEDMSINTLMDIADKSLYESKRNGRNRVTAIQE